MLVQSPEFLSSTKNHIRKHIAYSCTVDRDPDSFFKSLIFISSLVELACVQPTDIFIHHNDAPDLFAAKMYENIGVNVVPFSAYHKDNSGLNKLAQLKTSALADYERIVICDCGIAITEAVHFANFSQGIYAKEVDLPNPPIWTLRRLINAAGMNISPDQKTTSFRAVSDKFVVNHDIPVEQALDFVTLANNCNSSICIIDRDTWLRLAIDWPGWTDWLMQQSAILDPWDKYADQISLALATWNAEIVINPLPLVWNFPLHLPLDTSAHEGLKPKVLNFRNEFAMDGKIKLIGIPSVDEVVNRVNEAYESFLSKLAVQDSASSEMISLRQKRWIEWNNGIEQRPLPLPDFMGNEKPLIGIETIGQCNNRCKYCPVSISPVRKGVLNTEIFKAVIDELVPNDGSFQLRFHFYNEPLLDKRLSKLIAYARKWLPNTYMRLVTNGELLDVNTATALFGSGVDQIAVSCHKEEVFNQLTEIANNQPAWNLSLRQIYSKSDFCDRRGLIDLESNGYTRMELPGIYQWGCSFLTVLIDFEGNVHMCPEDFTGELILGNVLEEGLASILKRNLIRLKRAYCGFFEGMCTHCAGL